MGRRDDWSREHDKDAIKRVQAQQRADGDQFLPLPSEREEAFYKDKQRTASEFLELAKIERRNGKAYLVVPDTDHPIVSIPNRVWLTELQYTFRRGRNNPVQVMDGKIWVEARSFFYKCGRIKMDVKALAAQKGLTESEIATGSGRGS